MYLSPLLGTGCWAFGTRHHATSQQPGQCVSSSSRPIDSPARGNMHNTLAPRGLRAAVTLHEEPVSAPQAATATPTIAVAAYTPARNNTQHHTGARCCCSAPRHTHRNETKLLPNTSGSRGSRLLQCTPPLVVRLPRRRSPLSPTHDHPRAPRLELAIETMPLACVCLDMAIHHSALHPAQAPFNLAHPHKAVHPPNRPQQQWDESCMMHGLQLRTCGSAPMSSGPAAALKRDTGRWWFISSAHSLPTCPCTHNAPINPTQPCTRCALC